MKMWLEILTIIVSGVAIIVSGLSCYMSLKSNDIAKEALETTKEHYKISQRPYVDLTLEEIDEKYRYIYFLEKDNLLHFFIKFKIINTGTTPAKKITFTKAKGTVSHPDIGSIEINFPTKEMIFELSSNQSEFIQLPGAVKNYINKNMSGGKLNTELLSLSVDLEVSYTSDLNLEEEHKTSVSYKIEKNNSTLKERKLD